MQRQLKATSHRISSRRLSRAVTLLTRAGRQLDSASKVADRYNEERLRFFASGFRDLANSFSKIASQLERGDAL
jgi:hypothetical protein